MLEAVRRQFERMNRFLKEEVWLDPSDPDRWTLLYYYVVRVYLITLHGLKNQLILLRASALSYSTLFAIVPIFAVAFSMMKGLGAQLQLERILINYLTAQQEAVTTRIITYISNTDFKALGAFGTAFLIYAVVMMLGNVESTFNDIWGVTKSRSVGRKITDYLSVLILGPLMMVIATTLIASFSSNTVIQYLSRYWVFERSLFLFNTILPYMALFVAFTAMYILMPNTRVRFLPALIAGILCGSLWELAFSLYTDVYVGVARYNTIYGTFAVIPIFIIWLYISWIIVLIGAQISYAIQNVKSFQQDVTSRDIGYEQQEEMAVHIMLNICERFHKGLPLITEQELSNMLTIPVRLVHQIVSKLGRDGMLRECSEEEEPILQPTRNLGLIKVLDICQAMRRADGRSWQITEEEFGKPLFDLFDRKRSAEADLLGGVSMRDLLERSQAIGLD